ncbi:MAG TPA: aspartate-alanine antiporter [Geminicoccaceae bacterium]|nr:aspartate-alanine antiporter [Geminicoccus sp.]HMU52111.1 aspartate-alanine antiporter [Geminicoccaceae bacterium]
MIDWLVGTLRHYPELAIFLTLAIGYWLGKLKVGGFSLGAVTGTLLAGVLIGQLHIDISANVKSVFFLMFLFAVGYGVGPQFVRGLGADGLKQMAFAVIVVVFCLLSAYVAALIAGLDVGYAAGLLSGASTISAVIGVATDAINGLGLPPDETRRLLDHIPIAYAVTYIFGTAGSAWFLASMGPKILGVDIVQECKEYEKTLSGGADAPEPGIISAYRRFEARAYRVDPGSPMLGKPVSQLLPGLRVFVERVRRGSQIIGADGSTVLQPGDVISLSGPRQLLVERVEGEIGLPEVEDRELLDQPAEALDVFVTSKELGGRTLEELAETDFARGVYLRRIMRSGIEIPILAKTTIHRGDILTLVGSKLHVEAAVKRLGYADRPTEMTDMVFVGLGIVLGGLVGALVFNVGSIPLSLSTSGGVLIAGLIFGWLRSVHPTFGGIPAPALWVMNSVGLNTFIAVVGISAGPGFVAGLQELGISLFLWGIFVTLVPLLVGLLAGKYIFRFPAPINLGCCAGARTTTAALGMITETAKSKVPALGYTVTYAVGNTLLTIWGLVIVLLMT